MIGSETRLVAIIGSPIAQVKSPVNFNRYFADHATDRAMIAVDLLSGSVADFVSTARGWRNLDGFVVTIPHKAAVAELVDEHTMDDLVHHKQPAAVAVAGLVAGFEDLDS